MCKAIKNIIVRYFLTATRHYGNRRFRATCGYRCNIYIYTRAFNDEVCSRKETRAPTRFASNVSSFGVAFVEKVSTLFFLANRRIFFRVFSFSRAYHAFRTLRRAR